MTNYIIHKAEDRGMADHGWLKTAHSFSFANWYNTQKIHFGALRVLNDDWIAPRQGFGMHPHENMEIITIPLSGALAHKDSMNNSETIHTGEVQIMSAGTGVFHSEFNASDTQPVSLLQTWVFPKEYNITPRYEQKAFDAQNRQNQWQVVVSPNKETGGLWINQDSVYSLANLSAGTRLEYKPHFSENVGYLFVITGKLKLLDQVLGMRDAIGINELKDIEIEALEPSEILMIEVPDVKVAY
jgi:redox-sensitive bicupin YhaK (pirin superfamily)